MPGPVVSHQTASTTRETVRVHYLDWLALKFFIVAPLAVALCYLTAYLVRKVLFVRSVL